MVFETGQKVRLPQGPAQWVTVDFAYRDVGGQWVLYVALDGENVYHKVVLTAEEATRVEIIAPDGCASSARALAGMWSLWISAAAQTPAVALRAYPHQVSAVYGAMLPQPRLRFLLADEPGTGKTVMAGLYLREMRRLGMIRRALIVAPAGLVSKWQADFERFFGGGLRRITSGTVNDGGALDATHPTWVVSLELISVNPSVLEAVLPERAGWDLVIFDEAHRLTPTAQAFYNSAKLLAAGSPRALLMTATPHRGSEWLFRHLLHLVDADIYPDPGGEPKARFPALRPGAVHFIRRMKEGLVDYDGVTPLFKGRRATNYRVPLNAVELAVYERALSLVDDFFPKQAQQLARMVYGKRAASSLYALAETLQRRRDQVDSDDLGYLDIEADDAVGRDEATVLAVDSVSKLEEKAAIGSLLAAIDHALEGSYSPSKWRFLTETCLLTNNIEPGNGRQAVVFTEYADTATWIARRLSSEGFLAKVYSGRQTHAERYDVRESFMRGEFQVIVSTDAGNEGIDLQTAHVLVNYDIPWSLVRLEQRMGRIHRVGQKRDVELYNLVAVETREGETLLKLLNNFVSAAEELHGKIFDSLSVVAELADVRYEEWLHALYGDNPVKRAEALAAAEQVSAADLRRRADEARSQEDKLTTSITVPFDIALPEPPLSPGVIESYLRTLRATGLIDVKATAAGDGILLLTPAAELSPDLIEGRPFFGVIDAAAADALDDRRGGLERMMFTAGSKTLTRLASAMRQRFSADITRGGPVFDPNALDEYDLFAFEATVAESAWSVLLKVGPDDKRGPTTVGWDVLTTLRATQLPGSAVTHARAEIAATEANSMLAREVARRQQGLREWLERARRELSALPVDVTMGIRDRSERVQLRERLALKAEHKFEQMDAQCHVSGTTPRLTGWLHVHPRDGVT